MGLIVRALTRRNIVAIVAGALLAGAPLVAFDFWLGGLIDRQGQEEVDTSAKRAIALAESRITQVIATLDGLAARGVDSCRPEDVEAMRQAAFDTMPVKEIGVVGPDGQTLCTDLGLPLGQRKLVSSEPLVGASWYSLDIVHLENGRIMVRLRRQVGAGPNGIAALVPAFLFLPQVSSQGGPFSAYAFIATASGAAISNAGERAGAANATYAAKATSDKYGFETEISMQRGRVIAGHADLQWLGLFATGAIIMTLGIFSMLMPRRRPGDPVAEIESALKAGEFVPYYQPIVDIRSGQLRGAEVLVRWRKADGTLVLPGAFIPLAESSGLIREMTRDLMRRVCAEAGSAIGCRPALKISFNFAGQLFSDEGIVKDVRKIFSGSPIKLSQVVLEVTERDPIENFTATRQTIAAFQGPRRAHRHRRRRHRPQRAVLYAQARRRHHQDRQDIRRRHRHRPQLHDHRADPGRSRAQYAHGRGGRGRGEFRAGDVSARARGPFGARLCVRAAAARQELPAIGRSHRSAARGGRRAEIGNGRHSRKRASQRRLSAHIHDVRK
jgi:Predicted signal transduction protein containing sensor and EAL domains